MIEAEELDPLPDEELLLLVQLLLLGADEDVAVEVDRRRREREHRLVPLADIFPR